MEKTDFWSMFGFLAWLAAGLVLLIAVPLYPRLCFVVYRNAAPLVGIALAIDLLSLPFALNQARASHREHRALRQFIFLWHCSGTFSAWTAFVFGGYAGMLAGLMLAGVGVVGIALLAAALHSRWLIVANIALGLLLTFGARVLTFWLTPLREPS
jgi:hypothetical protein